MLLTETERHALACVDPVFFVQHYLGVTPDLWQKAILEWTTKRMVVCTSRQVGKSTCASWLAAWEALRDPNAMILVVAPTLRQSGELFRKITENLRIAGAKRVEDNKTSLELSTGARVVSLPGEGDFIRGFSGVTLLLVDEAAYAPDSLFHAVSPMLAASNGRQLLISTPNGSVGHFYETFTHNKDYERVAVTAYESSRISKDFLEAEARALPAFMFRAEYLCSFEQKSGALLTTEQVDRTVSASIIPLEIL